ncbi:hypothetical protein ACDP63_05300 [Paracoccus sp. P2]|uniref:hypothetical protein n=1 Tax=Paracoccus TaxID=265 RepID=UPI001E4427B3|nr:hypothetical protein [Paracoccus pantotrophus]MDF3853149.1 hypothetical protein [Paracoccus pantotrophus]
MIVTQRVRDSSGCRISPGAGRAGMRGPVPSGRGCGEKRPPKRLAIAAPSARAQEGGIERQAHQQKEGQALHGFAGHGLPFGASVGWSGNLARRI